jgi:TRAP transporter TAXI family solute receptor
MRLMTRVQLTRVLCLLSVGLWLSASFAPRTFAQDVWQQRDAVNAGTVGIVSGGVTGTYVRIASDLSNALDSGYELRVLVVLGKGSIRNLEDLLLLKGIDIAIVQSDVLDFYRTAGIYPNIDNRVRYITKLYNEEVHILARSDIADVSQLAGRKVNFGTQGSGTFMTASIVFESLDIDVDATTFPEPIALEKLRQGEIAALVFVGGKPLDLVLQVAKDDGLALLSVPLDQVEGAYLPGSFSAADYPELVAAGEEIPTVAVGSVMAVYNWASDNPRYQKVSRFVTKFFDDFETFQDAPYHLKWREVDLRAEVPGWRRFGPAQEWLSANQ